MVGANVWLDGTQAGILGADGLILAGVSSGTHEIVISKAGYEKFERQVAVTADSTETVAVELKAIEQSGEGAAVPAETLPVAAPSSRRPPEPPIRPRASLAWLFLGAGLVGVGMGGYSSYQIGVVNSNLDRYRRYACSTGGPEICSADGKEKLGELTPQERRLRQPAAEHR